MLPEAEQKSALSEAYIHAVASAAGFVCDPPSRRTDNLGIDATIGVSHNFGQEYDLTRFTVNIQLKATTTPVIFNTKGIYRYEIKAKTYNEYACMKCSNLQLLVLLALPENTTSEK